MKKYLTTKFASYVEKLLVYFERLLQSVKKQKSSMETHVHTNFKHLCASYEASYQIVKSKKPFTIGEELVLPIAVRMTEIIHGHKYANEFLKILLSNTTVSRGIEDISQDQFVQLIARIKGNSHYAIQIDKSTDISSKAHMLVYVRYCFNINVYEDFFFVGY